jgi:hypothetical protein
MSHTTRVVNLSYHCTSYPVSSTVPLYTVEEPDHQAPVRKLAAQTLHSSARLGSPGQRVGRCLEFGNYAKQSPDACNRTSVHTPLVIGKVRFTRLLCVNFGANAPSTVAKIVNKLTVPTVGMSVCESFYRKSESSAKFNPGPPVISR